LLVVTASATTTTLATTPIGNSPGFARADVAVAAPPCGKQDIQALLYAADLMLPVLPLHQADKCELTRTADTHGWQWAEAVFSVIGKIATALALLTFSGVLKPKDE
jgi:hypothetical protein